MARREKMNHLKGAIVGSIVLLAIFSLPISVQAPNGMHVLGHVYYPDGTTPVSGATVSITNLNTGDSRTTKALVDGYYEFNLPWFFDTPIEIAAIYGSYYAKKTVTLQDPTFADLILQEVQAPALTPTGLLALVSLLSAITAVTIVRKRR
jgi:hypothetical protein